MKRIDNLTGVRAFAALWVVLFHLNYAPPVHHIMGGVVEHGLCGVDVFFVLSGFVLSIVYASRLPARVNGLWYRKFIVRRFAKIYPLHLITFLLMVALVLLGRHLHYRFVDGARNSWWSAFCNLFLVHSLGLTKTPSWNYPSWSVSAEWMAYAVFFTPLAFLCRNVRAAYITLAAAIAWTLFCLNCTYVLHSNINVTTLGVLRILPEFLCGYALWRCVEKIKPKYGDVFTGAGLATLCAICYLPAGMIWLLMPAVALLITGLYFGGPVSKLIFGNKLAILLGDCSYSIYLTQAFVLIAMSILAGKVHWLRQPVPYVVAALFAVAATGIFTFFFIEEPLRKWVLRVLEPRGKNPEQNLPVTIPGVAPDAQLSSTIG
jgi:peptidoglycan/LPS O-acetylase OafA/YrhL